MKTITEEEFMKDIGHGVERTQENWKEKLQSEIMEEYIFLAEMKQHAKDKTAHMVRMREQWDKLCNFIQEERNAVLSEVEREVEKKQYYSDDGQQYVTSIEDISTIINNLKVK